MVTERNGRRNSHTERKTYSAYVDSRVMDALDMLVKVGTYANRSDAIEDACRRLVILKAPAMLSTPEEVAA